MPARLERMLFKGRLYLTCKRGQVVAGETERELDLLSTTGVIGRDPSAERDVPLLQAAFTADHRPPGVGSGDTWCKNVRESIPGKHVRGGGGELVKETWKERTYFSARFPPSCGAPPPSGGSPSSATPPRKERRAGF